MSKLLARALYALGQGLYVGAWMVPAWYYAHWLSLLAFPISTGIGWALGKFISNSWQTDVLDKKPKVVVRRK